ncbi:MAG: fibronectin type III domain-containing protein [Planctomycetales bacterium]|nr:fibronectin type III domain-containing protein [bacterium]UNM09400.1 MAG: fibronectin type III domain-containing protein [Planctomycetales bacterium]
MKILLQNCRFVMLVTLALALVSCGSGDPRVGDTGTVDILPAEAGDLSWPPADNFRKASDDSIELLGNEFSSAGGGAHAVSTVCKLNDGTAPWAIYSLSSFDTLDLGSIKAEYNILTGAGTVLYIGMANYNKGRWEWFSTTENGSYTFTPVTPAHYASPNGNVHIALLRTGPATIDVQKLTFNRVGDVTITAPKNLRSDEQTPENIGLQWDPVPGAQSYNVYFSRWSDLRDPLKLNTEPVTGPDFDYTPILKGVIYYFFVTAVGATESGPSDYIDLFAPTIDMPAPQNPRVDEATPDSVTIGWDWNIEELGPEPANGFYVYLKAEKDFNLEPEIEIRYRSQSWARSAQFNNLQTNTLYYFRIVGVSLNNSRGRMTDDLPAITGEFWDWTQVHPIGNGSEPIRAVATGNTASVIWLGANAGGTPSGSVAFAQGTGSSWSVGDCGLEFGTESFDNYLDISERNGKFLVGAFDFLNQDLYASYGDPGNGWTKEFVADGTKVGQFDVPSAGNHLSVAITDDSYYIIDKDYYAKLTYMREKPIAGGSWTSTSVRTLNDSGFPVQLEMKANGNNPEYMYFDYEIHELLFGKGPAPYAPAVISDNMGDNNGLYTDLVMTPGGWVSTSYDVTNDDLYLLRQSGGSWNSEDLATGGYGGHARLEPFRGTGLICVYLDDSTNWYCSVYDGSQWFQQVMLMPIVKPATGAELVVVNDVPYFLVEETESTSPNKDKIMCVTGVIPPFGEL